MLFHNLNNHILSFVENCGPCTVCVCSVGSHVFNDILLSRCITKFSFMFVLKTSVKSRIMIRVLKTIFLSTSIDENKERTNVDVRNAMGWLWLSLLKWWPLLPQRTWHLYKLIYLCTNMLIMISHLISILWLYFQQIQVID